MIRNIMQCDNCGKQADVRTMLLSIMQVEPPKDWIVLCGTSKKAEHYCSNKCLLEKKHKEELN